MFTRQLQPDFAQLMCAGYQLAQSWHVYVLMLCPHIKVVEIGVNLCLDLINEVNTFVVITGHINFLIHLPRFQLSALLVPCKLV